MDTLIRTVSRCSNRPLRLRCGKGFLKCGKELLSTTVRGGREECWGRKKSIGRIRVKGGGRSRDEKEERGRGSRYLGWYKGRGRRWGVGGGDLHMSRPLPP